MTVRVRRAAVAGAMLAVGSLVTASVSLGTGLGGANPNLNFRLAQQGGADVATGLPPSGTAWAFRGRSAGSWADAESSLTVGQLAFPDGLDVVALAVKIGSGHPLPVLTNAVTTGDLVAALGVKLSDSDLIRPPAETLVYPGMRFRVIRIRRVVETRPEATPFETLIQQSSDLNIGESNVITPGKPGSTLRTFRVTYRNGKEVRRVLLSDRVVSEPVDQVVVQGTSPILGYQSGQASWYYCPDEGDFAAHLSLPKGTVVTVTNLDNGKSVTVVINDRGPYGVDGRIIDLCSSAFAQIAPLGQGVANVEITW